MNRARNPGVPPVTPEPDPPTMPSVDVETHKVEVPVERRSCPYVPVAFVESKRFPLITRLVVVEVTVSDDVAKMELVTSPVVNKLDPLKTELLSVASLSEVTFTT